MAEQTIIIVDNSGRTKTETILYTAQDILGEVIYITAEGVQYAQDSLARKRQSRFISHLSDLSRLLKQPDIVIIKRVILGYNHENINFYVSLA